MRKSGFLTLYFGLLLLLLTLSAIDAGIHTDKQAARMALMSQLVAELELTDLSLFTEARYTRHLSQADLHTAFQDHPFAFEHFPSGSLVTPPAILQSDNESANSETTLSD